MSKLAPRTKSALKGAALLPSTRTKDEKSLGKSTAKTNAPKQATPLTATRAKQPKAPKDGTDGSIVLRPEHSGSE